MDSGPQLAKQEVRSSRNLRFVLLGLIFVLILSLIAVILWYSPWSENHPQERTVQQGFSRSDRQPIHDTSRKPELSSSVLASDGNQDLGLEKGLYSVKREKRIHSLPGVWSGRAIAFWGNLLYVLCPRNKVDIVREGPSGSLEKVKTWTVADETDIYDLDIQAGYLYLACGSGLRIFDLRDPRQPEAVTSISFQRGTYSVRVGRGHAFILQPIQSRIILHAFRLQTPTELKKSSQLSLDIHPLLPVQAHVSGRWIRVDSHIIDASNPKELRLFGNIPFKAWRYGGVDGGGFPYFGWPDAATIHQGHYYVTEDYRVEQAPLFVTSTLGIYRLEGERRPAKVGTVQLNGCITFMCGYGDKLCAQNDLLGLQVYSLSDRQQLVLQHECPASSPIRALAARKNAVYLLGATDLCTVDLEMLGSFAYAGRCKIGASRGQCQVVERVAYVATEAGLEVVDLANPPAPKLLTGFSASAGTGVCVYDGKCYLTDDKSLHILDVSKLPHIQELGLQEFRFEPLPGLAVNGTHAYLPFKHGIQILDVSNPASIRVLGGFTFDKRMFKDSIIKTVVSTAPIMLTPVGDLLFFNLNGLFVVDVSDPAKPVFLGELENCAPRTPPVPSASLSNAVWYQSQTGLHLATLSDGPSLKDITSIPFGSPIGMPSRLVLLSELLFFSSQGGDRIYGFDLGNLKNVVLSEIVAGIMPGPFAGSDERLVTLCYSYGPYTWVAVFSRAPQRLTISTVSERSWGR